MADDVVLHSVPDMISANRSKAWHDKIVQLSTVLMCFLKNNGIIVSVEPFDDDGKIKEDFVLMKSNLRDEGFELFKNAVQGWLKFVDRGGNIENISRLEKGLAHLRENDAITPL
jgi:hypothetical protein